MTTTLDELESLTAGEVSTEANEAEADAGDNTDAEKADRSATMKANRAKKLDKLFADGRKYQIVKKVKATSGVKHPTPLGNNAAAGFLMIQVEGPMPVDWQGDPERVRFFLGTTAVNEAAENYGAITNGDEFLKARKPRKSKEEREAADSAKKAEFRAATDALFAEFETA